MVRDTDSASLSLPARDNRGKVTSWRFDSLRSVGFLGSVMSLVLCMTWGVTRSEGLQAAEPVESLRVGFDEVDITPEVGAGRPVWIAGYDWGREATGIHDRLYARCVVLGDGKTKIALVSVDLVGLQYPEVMRIREALPEIDYVLVSSTHNHEGPDTIGLWGKNPLTRGVDPDYLKKVVETTAVSVREALRKMAPARVRYGTAEDETLVSDSRFPKVKDGVLRTLQFESPDTGKLLGVLVQWNCHPEAMGPKNTLLTADFVGTTVEQLKERYQVPVAYFTGALGGLMAPPDHLFHDEQGKELKEGDFAYSAAYGRAVAELAGKSLAAGKPIELVPLRISQASISLPVHNAAYRAARTVGVLRRKGVGWTGDFRVTDAPPKAGQEVDFAVVTEVACLQLGQLRLASIPGELYPELVYGKFQEPAEAAADFPEAALEPTVAGLLGDGPWMLFGLANDEIGYIIPKRQWDEKPPYAYGREKSQYGEINSCGPEVAPLLMEAFAERVKALAP